MQEGITGMHHVAIIGSNKDRTLKFYEALGFCMRSDEIRPDKNDEIIMLEGYGITIELFIKPSAPPRLTEPEACGLRHLALRVEKGKITEIIDILKSAGYSAEQIRTSPTSFESFTFLNDPDGLPIELHE